MKSPTQVSLASPNVNSKHLLYVSARISIRLSYSK
jgi:hypothetical protein